MQQLYTFRSTIPRFRNLPVQRIKDDKFLRKLFEKLLQLSELLYILELARSTLAATNQVPDLELLQLLLELLLHSVNYDFQVVLAVAGVLAGEKWDLCQHGLDRLDDIVEVAGLADVLDYLDLVSYLEAAVRENLLVGEGDEEFDFFGDLEEFFVDEATDKSD